MKKLEAQKIKKWLGSVVPSKEEAWTLTKQDGYYFHEINTIEAIEENEWKEIASWPPLVTLREYLELRKEPLSFYKEEFRKMQLTEQQIRFLFNGHTKREDFFFYWTRKFLPEQMDLTDRIERLVNFKTLLPVNKQLIQKLYNLENNIEEAFMKADPIYYTIEKWIFTFNEFITDPQVLFALLVDMDVQLPKGADLFTFIYDVLLEKIKELHKKK